MTHSCDDPKACTFDEGCDDGITYAPSEENVLLCDIPNCEASVSMVIGVPRSEHGWGRLTLYRGLGDSVDYDLCHEHNTEILKVLAGN